MEPITELDQRFSSEGAAPTPWAEARRLLDAVKSFWLTTVRADGRPHATTLLAVRDDGRLHFCTGPTEQKYRNLEANPHCILSTGSSDMDGGVDGAFHADAGEAHVFQLVPSVGFGFAKGEFGQTRWRFG